jgi:hypothetical protein
MRAPRTQGSVPGCRAQVELDAADTDEAHGEVIGPA